MATAHDGPKNVGMISLRRGKIVFICTMLIFSTVTNLERSVHKLTRSVIKNLIGIVSKTEKFWWQVHHHIFIVGRSDSLRQLRLHKLGKIRATNSWGFQRIVPM